MRALLAFTLLLLFWNCNAQQTGWEKGNTYRQAGNPHYWKNKLPYAGYWQQDVYYHIVASLDDSAEVITGTETLVYYNNSPNTLTEAYFHLYQNAVQPGSLVDELYTQNRTPHRFGKYESKNLGTEITSASVNGVAQKPEINFTVMRLRFDVPLRPGDSAAFAFTFKTYFDRGSIRRRMKVYDHHGFKHFNGVHWYPRICVYDRKFAWETAQHMEHEFYGDYGAYDVELKLPSEYVNEATGELQNETEVYPGNLRAMLDIRNFKNRLEGDQPGLVATRDGKHKAWRYHATNVHDFAWTADPTYRIGEVMWNGVKCIALAQEQNAWKWQPTDSFVAYVVATYSRDFGMYEYPKMIAADAADGMEYPMLTLDGGDYPGHRGLIAHEVGHNWFFGMVGNNETYRAALDEGFTQFLTAWSMKKLTGNNRRPSDIEYNTAYFGYLRDAIDGTDPVLSTHSDDFHNAIGHGGGYGHVYYKTATMLYNLEYVLGDSVFKRAMQNYVRQWKFCHPYIEDFRNSIIMSAGSDLNWFFDQWFETSKYIDYKVKSVKRIADGDYHINLERKGSMVMPLDLRITLRNGSVMHVTVPVSYYNKPNSIHPTQPWQGWGILRPEYTLQLHTESAIRNVEIDTSGRLADIDLRNNSWKRKRTFSFDKENELSRDHRGGYDFFWRPDLWYSYADGLRVGAKLSGNYAARKHIFNLYGWYNTRVLAGTGFPNESLILQPNTPKPMLSYYFDYRHFVRGAGELVGRSSLLAGRWIHRAGWESNTAHGRFSGFIKYMQSAASNRAYAIWNLNNGEVSDYTFLPDQDLWSKGNNISLNLQYKHNYKLLKSSGSWEVALRTSTPFSDAAYGYLQFTQLHNKPVGKTTLRTRVFAIAGQGKNSPAESMLYAAGANPEEVQDNKYVRDLAMLPVNTENSNVGYRPIPLALGGGLNLRGFSGYMLPRKSGDSAYLFYRGNNGFAVNAEWDFGGWFGFLPKVKMLSFNPYIFGDAGVLAYPIQGSLKGSGLLADAGIGMMVNIGNWQSLVPRKQRPALTATKPLQLRLDFPLFVNAVQAGEDYLAFRWVLGIARTF